MCTSFEQSFLRVLQKFRGKKLQSADCLYEQLGDEVLQLSLGGATLYEFLEALVADGYLERKGECYRLSAKGRKRANDLKQIVGVT